MTIYNPQHMEVSGNDWEQWRAHIWNQHNKNGCRYAAYIDYILVS